MRMQRVYGFALVAAVIGCSTTVQQGRPAPHPVPVRQEARIDLWMAGDRMVRRGDDVRVTFRATESGYAMVGRIDTDGRLQVLWPRTPGESDHVWANQTYEVRRYGDRAFSVDDRSGTGYVFAIVSERPIASLRWARNFNWDHDALGSPVRGDPYVAMHHIAERVVGDADVYYDLAYLDYHVDRRYAYPRFVCYDCHYGTRGSIYDVYDHACVKYRVVVYDDPNYYPYRQGGRRVVYARPRYEFKPVAANEPAGTVEYRRRTDTVDRRRAGRPTEDPNLPPPNAGTPRAPGATRPGDDAGNTQRDPRDDRRGGQGQSQGEASGRDRNQPPAWGQSGTPGSGNTGGNGNAGNGNSGNGGNTNECNGVGNPCNGNNGNGNSGNNGNAGGNGNPGNGGGSGNGGNGNAGGNGNVRQPTSQPADRRQPPRTERPREEPRAEQPRSEPPREEPRRVTPAREEAPREEAPRQERPREEPRREEPRREEPRQEEPRQAQPERREQPKPAAKPASRKPDEPEPRRRP